MTALISTVMGVWIAATLLAQAAPSEWISVVQALGFPTVVAAVVGWVVLSGKIPREAEIQTLRDIITTKDRERERLEAQVDSFAKQYETIVLPAVHDAITSIRETAKVIEQQTTAARQAGETIRRMDENIRGLERSLGRQRQAE